MLKFGQGKIISNSIFCHIAHHFATMSDARLDVQHIQYILRQTLGKITVALINTIFPYLLTNYQQIQWRIRQKV